MRTVDDEILIALNQIKDALKNREPSSGGNSGGSESSDGEETFEDWKRNIHAFPVDSIIDYENDGSGLVIHPFEPSNTRSFGGVYLGLQYLNGMEVTLGIPNDEWVDLPESGITWAYYNHDFDTKRKNQYGISNETEVELRNNIQVTCYLLPNSSFGIVKMTVDNGSFLTPITIKKSDDVAY